MDIERNIFGCVNQIRDFNQKIENFNKMLEQYFLLEFSYVKNKYLYEKNLKANLRGAEEYNKLSQLHQVRLNQLVTFRNSQDYVDWLKKAKKINKKIDFYEKELNSENVSQNQKYEFQSMLKNIIEFKNKFNNSEKIKNIKEKEKKYAKEIFLLERYLNQNMHFANIDMSSEKEISNKIKSYYLKKEQVFAEIKGKNMPQERLRLSGVIQKIENKQKQVSNFAFSMPDKRFELREINYVEHLERFKENLFRIIQPSEVGIVEKYLFKINQKFSEEGFENQKI